MLIARPVGENVRIHGKQQGFLGLPVLHQTLEDGTPQMVTCWTPTPEELVALNAGANVIVMMLGELPPPLLVTVGTEPVS
jgi:hypothetical protein